MGPSAVPTTNLGVLVCGWLPKGVTSGRYATCCVRVPSALEKALDPVHGAVGARLSCATRRARAHHPVSLNTGRSHTYTATDTAHTRGGRAVAAPRGVFSKYKS